MQNATLSAFLRRWSAAAPHDLSASESATLLLRDLLGMAAPEDLQRWQDLAFAYSDPRGAPWLRETIAATYGTLAGGDVLCFAGAQEAIACTARALLGPLDHAIVVVPCYQPSELAVTAVAPATGVALDQTAGWGLDLDRVAAAIRPSTRMVVTNFPNNPTGALVDRTTLDALIALCRQRRLWLVNDEVYRLIDRDPATRLPQVADLYERGISVNALSKSFGLPGLRVGWVACRDQAALTRMQLVKSTQSGSLATPSEVLAQIALRAQLPILKRNGAIAEANLGRLRGFFARHANLFVWDEPTAGVTAFPRYLGPEGVESFVETLAREAGVLVLPASIWRSALAPTPTDRFRVGFGGTGVIAALAAWETFLTCPDRTAALVPEVAS